MATTEKETDKKKPLTLSRPGRLELKKTVEGGQVKQSFSHGRSKTVTVEVKKKRTFRQDAGGEMTEVKAQPEPLAEPEAPAQQQVEEPVRETPPVRTLTETEQARARRKRGMRAPRVPRVAIQRPRDSSKRTRPIGLPGDSAAPHTPGEWLPREGPLATAALLAVTTGVRNPERTSGLRY